MNRRWMIPLAVLAYLAVVAQAPGADEQSAEEAIYVMYSGSDTLMLERFIRTEESVDGVMVLGRRLMQGYTMTLGDKASVSALDLRLRPYPAMPESAQMYIYVKRAGRDVHVLHRDGAQRMNTDFEIDADVLLGVAGSVSFLEQLVRRARALGETTSKITVYLPSTRKKWVAEVSTMKGDSTRVVLSGEEWRFKTDPEGRLLGGETVRSKVKMLRFEVEEQDGPARSVAEH